jgi:serine protease Do
MQRHLFRSTAAGPRPAGGGVGSRWASGAGAAAVPQRAQAQQVLPDFTDLVEKVGPAVVNIRTTERVRSRARRRRRDGRGPAGVLPPLRRAHPGQPPTPRRGQPQPPPPDASRSARRRLRLHPERRRLRDDQRACRRGADEVIVTLTDRREFKAKIIGADKRTDVALVKIDATGLPVVRIGDVEPLKVGEWVIGDRLAVRPGEHRDRPASSARRRATPATSCPSSRPTSAINPATRAGR